MESPFGLPRGVHRRALGALTSGALVAGTLTAFAVAAAAPAVAAPSAVTLHNNYNYKCDVDAAGIKLGIKNVGIDATVQVPRSVEPGQTIPARKTQITLTMPEDLRAPTVGLLEAKTAGGSSSDTAITITAPGVPEALTVPIKNLSAPQTDVPTTADKPWTIPTEGDVPAITVPAVATDSATLRMPKRFTIDATLIQASGKVVGGTGAVKLRCDLDTDGPNGDGVFGEIPVVPAGTPLTARDITWTGPIHRASTQSANESGRIRLAAVGGTGDDVSYEVVTQPTKGKVTIDGVDAVVSQESDAPFGSYSFTYRATGENGQVSAPATATFELTNEAPLTRTLSFTTTKGKPLDVWPFSRDNESGGPFPWMDSTSVAYGDPGHGTVQPFFTADNPRDEMFVATQHKATYVPDAGFVGKDSFTYAVTDGHGATSTGTINVDVRPTPAAVYGALTGARYRCAFAVRAAEDGVTPDPEGEVSEILSSTVNTVMGGDVTFLVDVKAHLPKAVIAGSKITVPDTDITLNMAQPMAELLAGTDISLPGPLSEAGFGQTAVQGKATADAVLTETATGRTYRVPMTDLTSANIPMSLPVPSKGVAIPVKGGIGEITVPKSGALKVSMPDRFFIDANLTPGVLGGFIKAVGLDCSAMAGENLTIASAPVLQRSKVAATAPSVRYGAASPRVNVAVAPTGATGKVEVRKGTKVLGRASVSRGKAAVALPRTALKPGTHALSVRYLGDAKTAPSSTSVRVKVVKAKAAVAAKVTTKKVVAKKTRAKVRVTVKASGIKPSGKVAVYYRGKKVGTATLRANGTAVVKLKKLPKAGKVSLKIRYLGNGTTAAATKTVKVKVKKRR